MGPDAEADCGRAIHGPGDIRCGSTADTANGMVRMFHAVSLDGDLETAKVLAFSLRELAAGVKMVEGADLELTAIVEPLRDVARRENAN